VAAELAEVVLALAAVGKNQLLLSPPPLLQAVAVAAAVEAIPFNPFASAEKEDGFINRLFSFHIGKLLSRFPNKRFIF
jgi:hypothetical protein